MKLFTKKYTAEYALKKMARVAGYRYKDCMIPNPNFDPDRGESDLNPMNKWKYELTWTSKKRERYKKWWIKHYTIKHASNRHKQNQWGMWDLMYGFRVK